MKCCGSYDGKFSIGLKNKRKKPLSKNPNILKGMF